MNLERDWMRRLAILSTLVNNAPRNPGRTALMKFAYLLQCVKNVPLGYRFKLYNYGPYDSAVLSDLTQAVTMKAIKSTTVHYSTGSGYEYAPHEAGYANFSKKYTEDIQKYATEINWVLAEFGNDTASRLELVSTIVFAEQEMRRKNQQRASDELRRRVKGIKPHFTDEIIADTIVELAKKGLIEVTESGSAIPQ